MFILEILHALVLSTQHIFLSFLFSGASTAERSRDDWSEKVVGYTNTAAIAAPAILCSLLSCWWECVLSKKANKKNTVLANASSYCLLLLCTSLLLFVFVSERFDVRAVLPTGCALLLPHQLAS